MYHAYNDYILCTQAKKKYNYFLTEKKVNYCVAKVIEHVSSWPLLFSTVFWVAVIVCILVSVEFTPTTVSEDRSPNFLVALKTEVVSIVLILYAGDDKSITLLAENLGDMDDKIFVSDVGTGIEDAWE